MKRLLLVVLVLVTLGATAQEASKKFAIHYHSMVGTSDGDIRFAPNGTADQWAPGHIYYDTKDLSQIEAITRYFPCRELTFSGPGLTTPTSGESEDATPELMMLPGERRRVSIAFVPAGSVMQYIERKVRTSNANVATALRREGNVVEVTAVAAGSCLLTVSHPEAGDRTIRVTVGNDEDYVRRTVDSLLALMTTEEKFKMVGGTNWFYTHGVSRLDIPQLRMDDGPQGVAGEPATAYPPCQALAATWNRQLAVRYGESLGRDCRARGIHFILGPGMNIYRAPFCGRNFEYMGEDPFLAGTIVAGYVRGTRAQGVCAVPKHFICNNSDYDRDHISNDMDERTMNEIYLPAFRAVIDEGGAGAIMTSYNLVNGTYTTHSRELLTTILRERWGYRGLVMSDWGSTHKALDAALAGLDLEMASGDHMSPDSLAFLIRQGKLTMDAVDDKVRHILHTMVSFGFHTGRQHDTSIPLDDPASDSTALATAREALILLKNSGELLPLDAQKHRRIVVTGKNALGYIHGAGSGAVTPAHYVGLYDGIKEVAERYGIEVEYKDKLDFLPQIIYTSADKTQLGLLAEYYNNTSFSGTPVATRVETKISYDWSALGPEVGGIGKKDYSVRWTGVICPERSGSYQFSVGGDDGFRLSIDGTVVADGWAAAAYHSKTATKSLTAGKTYSIVLEYYQQSGGAQVDLSWKRANDTMDYLAQYLKQADVVVACIGHNSTSEGEGFDRSYELPSADTELIATIAKSGRPMVAVVNAGGAVEMLSWQAKASAILWGTYGGQRAGTALGEALMGETNPSGKLPYTMERKWADNPCYNSYHDPDHDKHVRYTEGIFVGYRGYDKLNRSVLYPFGYGLSYTTFALTGMTLSQPEGDGALEVTCQLTNTGNRAGAQVVQAYVGRQGGAVERPIRELKGFEKVFLQPGETRTVSIRLPWRAFSYYETAIHDFLFDPGLYRVEMGFSSRDIQCSQEVEVLP